MSMSFKRGGLQLAGTALLLMAGAAQAASFTIADIGSFSTDYGATVTDINNAGQVVGYSYDGTGNAAFVYSGGTLVNLRSSLAPFGTIRGSSLYTTHSYAQGINESGQVVGYTAFTDPTVGFSWSNGVATDLGVINNYPTAPRAVNGSGQIVSNNVYSGLYNPGSGWTTLPGTWLPTALNDAGLQGGSLYLGYAYHAALRTADGTITDLDPLGGNGNVNEINASGQAAGTRFNGAGERGFFWNGTAMQDIGLLYTPPGGFNTYSGAEGINASGHVVGYSDTSPVNNAFNCLSGSRHAVLFRDGTLTDLNSLIDLSSGWCLQYASAINDSGQIAGSGISPNGKVHAFLLTPTAVPLPGAAWLLGTGLLSIVGARRRRAR